MNIAARVKLYSTDSKYQIALKRKAADDISEKNLKKINKYYNTVHPNICVFKEALKNM